MDSFFTGSVQSWLAVAVATLSPPIALIVGFAGADWLLQRQPRERCAQRAIGGRRGQGRLPERPLGKWSSSAGVRCPDRRNLTGS
jgi:hypothetical protein